MTRAWKIAAAAAVALVALAGAGVAVLFSLDFNEYRGFIAARVEAATGRALTIAGDLEVGVSLKPTIVARNLTLANAPWGTRPEMARLERLEAELAFWPLLSGEVEVRRLVLVGLDAVIETDAEGRGNWVFDDEPGDDEGGAAAWSGVEEVTVENAKIAYRSGRTGADEVVTVESLLASAAGPREPIHLELRGSNENVPFRVVGEVGSVRAFSRRDAALPLDFRATVLGTRFMVEGTVAEMASLSGIGLAATISGDDFAASVRGLRPWIPALRDFEPPRIGPFTASARLSGSADKLAASGLSAKAGGGGATATAKGAIADILDFAGAELAVTVEAPEAAAVLEVIRPVVPALGSAELPPLGPVSASARLRGSARALALSELSARVGNAESLLFTAEGAVEDAIAFAGVDLAVSAKGTEAQALFQLARSLTPALAAIEVPALGPVVIEARLRGSAEALAVSDLSASVGRAELLRVTAKGAIRDVLELGGFDLAISAEGRDLKPFAQALRTPLPELSPLSLTVKVSDDGKTYVFDDLKASLGGNDVKGDVTVTFGGQRPRVVARLDSAVIDLDALLPERPKRGAQGRLFSKEPLAWEALKAADVGLKLRIAQLRISGVALKDFAMDMRLDDGSLAIAPFRLSPQNVAGRFEGELQIDANASPPSVTGWLNADRLDAGRVLKVLDVSQMFDTTLNADLDVQAQGRSLSELMASLDGRLQVIGHKGRIDSAGLRAAVTGIVDVLPWIDSEEANNINCVVSRFDIADGIAASQAFLLDTNGMSVLGGGTVNLGEETLDLYLVPKPKKVSLASLAMPVNIGGTLADPELSPAVGRFALEKAKEVITRPVGTAFDILRSPVDIIGKLVGAEGEKETSDACMQALASLGENGEESVAAKGNSGAAPTEEARPAETGSLLRGLDSTLRGIFGGN